MTGARTGSLRPAGEAATVSGHALPPDTTLRIERLGIFTISSAMLLALAALLVFRYRVYFGEAISRAYLAASVVLS